MKADSDLQIRNRLVKHLKGGEAFLPLDSILNKIAYEQLGVVPEGLPYSFYQQFYHIWMAQHDIAEYCMNPDYQSPDWPRDYWPDEKGPVDEEEWKELVSSYLSEREKLINFIQNKKNDLLGPVSSNPDHSLLREILIVIEHTSYHTGQLMIISRLLRGSD
jgi:hypothetical protein